MKRLLAICAAALFAIAPVSAMAQETAPASKPADKPAKTLTTTGTVTAVAADSLTIKAPSGELTFTIDSKTSVTGTGIGTKSAALKKEGKATPITEFVHIADRVSVKYQDTGATKLAAEVRVLSAKPAK